MRRTAVTAPRGAIVIESPFGTKIWSIFPNTAIAANAPAVCAVRKEIIDLITSRNNGHLSEATTAWQARRNHQNPFQESKSAIFRFPNIMKENEVSTTNRKKFTFSTLLFLEKILCCWVLSLQDSWAVADSIE